MRPETSGRRGESGIILTELAVSLPIFVLLLTFLAFASAWGWRTYRQQAADAELHQEMQIVFARVVESALLSDRIGKSWQNGYEMRRNLLTGRPLDRYWVDEGQLVLNHGSFPLTGAFAGAGVHISEFVVEEDAVLPRLYHIRMTGESTVTGHTCTLATAVYLREGKDARP
ncbi:hypothetical protein [Selenomonas sp. F0473]|uniref:hypothetical protein n=1 Tax=Selenomonas sp. F0473 TaxID=999423 RepID=UPI00029DF06C|nr:hypothetical protein [Selenomonas sp. F0473]EKU70487.1 hypothetical protein HMPREF9161_01533 [Selenomonas sp. F0473]